MLIEIPAIRHRESIAVRNNCFLKTRHTSRNDTETKKTAKGIKIFAKFNFVLPFIKSKLMVRREKSVWNAKIFTKIQIPKAKARIVRLIFTAFPNILYIHRGQKTKKPNASGNVAKIYCFGLKMKNLLSFKNI